MQNAMTTEGARAELLGKSMRRPPGLEATGVENVLTSGGHLAVSYRSHWWSCVVFVPMVSANNAYYGSPPSVAP